MVQDQLEEAYPYIVRVNRLETVIGGQGGDIEWNEETDGKKENKNPPTQEDSFMVKGGRIRGRRSKVGGGSPIRLAS